MASDQSSIASHAERTAAAKARAIEFWDAKIEAEDGTFEFVFGDPTSTPYAIQLKIYYDEEEEVGFEIGYEAVEKSHFAAEDSYSAQEKATLQGLIADALPLLDEAAYKFSQAVNDALLTFEDHKSFYDPLTAEYYRLKEIERLARQERIDKLRAKEALFKKAASEVKGKTRFQMMKEAKIMQQAAMEANKYTFTRSEIIEKLKHGYVFDMETGKLVRHEAAAAVKAQDAVERARNSIQVWKYSYDKFGDYDVANNRARNSEVAAVMPTIHAEHCPPDGKPRVTPPWNDEEESFFEYLELVAACCQRIFQFGNAGIVRVPRCVSVLKDVTEINLNDNKIMLIPAELVSLPNLRRLFLANNKIKMIPDMSGSVNLEVLDVRQNALSGVPMGIGQCQKLAVFDAEKNKIKDFRDLAQCLNLDFINLNRNLIKIVPGELVLLEKLQYMQIKHNPIVNLPPHIYIQGMAAIMAYINDQTNLEASLQTSSIRADFLNLIASAASLTDFELISTKAAPEIAISFPYKEKTLLDRIDAPKVLALLLTNDALKTPHPTSVKVHSLFLISRLPILRDRVIEAVKSGKAALSLSVTPKDLNTLIRFIYSDSYDKPTPPSQETAEALSKRAPKRCNIPEVETLRHTLVQSWRGDLLNTVDLGKEFQLPYLSTLAMKAMGAIESETSPFATSTFARDLEILLPTSKPRKDVSMPELNMEDAMRYITEGFSELSMLGGQLDPSALPSFASFSSAPVDSPSAVATDCTEGVRSAVWAPNDIAFRIVNDPGAPLIGAHKTILSARSPYLHTMLTGGLIESTQTIIDMSDISYDTLKAIVEFCYRDDVTDIHGEMIMELLMKARLFGMDRLLSFVESIVGYSLDVSNVTGILSVAYMYSLPRLFKAAKFFVVSNWSKVTSDSSWEDLSEDIRAKLTKVAIKWGIADPKANDTLEAESGEHVEIRNALPLPSEDLDSEETLVEA